MNLKDWILLSVPTLISIASFAVSFLSFHKDKPDLKISYDYSVSLDEYPTISLTVHNKGKRPISIIEAGFRPNDAQEFTVVDKTNKPIRGISDIKILPTPLLIDSGEAKRFDMILRHWPSPFIHADTQLNAYAKDVSGNYYYGIPVIDKSILRHIIDSKGRMPQIPAKLKDPSTYQARPLTLKELYPNQKLKRFKIQLIDFLKAQL